MLCCTRGVCIEVHHLSKLSFIETWREVNIHHLSNLGSFGASETHDMLHIRDIFSRSTTTFPNLDSLEHGEKQRSITFLEYIILKMERRNAPPLVCHHLSNLGSIQTCREAKSHHLSKLAYIDCRGFNLNLPPLVQPREMQSSTTCPK